VTTPKATTVTRRRPSSETSKRETSKSKTATFGRADRFARTMPVNRLGGRQWGIACCLKKKLKRERDYKRERVVASEKAVQVWVL
jgi:hypothetical protein